MSDHPDESERRLINGSNIIEAVSFLAPDADPAVLMGTVEEFTTIRDSVKRLYELGLVVQVGVGAVLANEKILTMEIDNS